MDRRQQVLSKARTAQTLLSREAGRTLARFHGAKTGRLVRAYWWSGRRNFGDLVTPFLLDRVGLVPLHVPKRRAQVVLAGSILNSLGAAFEGVVVGAGAGMEGPGIDLRHARVLAVRGRLSWDRIGQPAGVILADPGLLLGRDLTHDPRFDLGVLPHYLDSDAALVRVFGSNPRVKIIDVARGPARVAAEIASCQFLASSSLHGLVVADAIGVPNVWFRESLEVVGGSYKFDDYGSSVGRQLDSVTLNGRESLAFFERVVRSADRLHVQQLAAQIEKAVASLPEILGLPDSPRR